MRLCCLMATGDSNPLFPPSLNDLNLPINPFNVMITISPAPIKEARSYPPANDDIPIQEKAFDISDISTPSLMVSSVNA